MISVIREKKLYNLKNDKKHMSLLLTNFAKFDPKIMIVFIKSQKRTWKNLVHKSIKQ